MAYWDTSALVKLYIPEPDSAVFNARIHPPVLALNKLDSDAVAGRLKVVQIEPSVLRRFETVVDRCYGITPPIALRTLDAIHLASAMASGATELVATDRRLRSAAVSLGLTVFPPP